MKFDIKKLMRVSGKRRELVNPEREWLLGLLLGALVFLGGSVYAGLLFLEIMRYADDGYLVAMETRVTFNENRLKEVLHVYEEKGERFSLLMAEGVGAIAPNENSSSTISEAEEPQEDVGTIAESDPLQVE
jgi:hypothetical protein